MTQDQVNEILRHVLTAVGSLLLIRGVVDVSTWTAITGAVMSIASVIWALKANSTTALQKKIAAAKKAK